MAPDEPVPESSGHLEVGGRRIWWERHGTGDREAVCLLNGLAMHTRAWYGFLPELLPDLDVVLYDYPGQGRSSAPDEPYLIPGFADYLRRILDRLAIDRVHVMGISYGGFVALEFARLYGNRLRTLTLSGILLSHERLFAMYQDLSLRFYRGGPEAFELYTHYMYERIFGEEFVRSIPPETLESMRQRFYERYHDRTHCLIRLTEAQDPFFAALDANLDGYRAIRAPTLILPGADDRAIPVPVQRKLADILPNARWHPIAGSGHVVYLEKKDAFFAALREFLKGV